jgi:hypothetical protein
LHGGLICMVAVPESRRAGARRFSHYHVARPTPRHHWGAALAAALISVALHVALVSTLMWGSPGAQPRRPPLSGIGASASSAGQLPVETLVLINVPGLAQSAARPPEASPSRGTAPGDLPIRIVSPDADPAEERAAVIDVAAPTPAPLQDGVERGILFGRYVDQVAARIERAWRRPRTPIGPEPFRCRAQVTQDRRGNVLEIALQDCVGAPRWQLSLVQAIQSSSPLPAPPDPAVFSDTLTLSFHSMGYAPGSDESGFEPLLPTLLAAVASTAHSASTATYSDPSSPEPDTGSWPSAAPAIDDRQAGSGEPGRAPGAAPRAGDRAAAVLPPVNVTPFNEADRRTER